MGRHNSRDASGERSAYLVVSSQAIKDSRSLGSKTTLVQRLAQPGLSPSSYGKSPAGEDFLDGEVGSAHLVGHFVLFAARPDALSVAFAAS